MNHMQRRALNNLIESVTALEYDMNHNTNPANWKRALAAVEMRHACLSMYIYKGQPNEEEGRLTEPEH